MLSSAINKIKKLISLGRGLPSSLMIEPTNACNLHCPTCPTGSGKMNRPAHMMTLQEFKRIIDQVKGYVQEIVLWNYGEPFLNNELLNMIRYATSSRMYVITSTNGEFFKSREFCLEVVKSGLGYLIICLDGADQETISRFRKGSKFDEIVKGIKLMVAAKKELGSKTPKIELQFILMKHNEHQRVYMRQLARELGADVYREKPAGIDYNDPKFQDMAKEFLPKDLSATWYLLKENGEFTLKGRVSNSCPWVYKTAVINSDGTVVPCCYDLYSEHVMGNIFKEDLKNIWKNENYQAFRKKIRNDIKSISICRVCPETR